MPTFRTPRRRLRPFACLPAIALVLALGCQSIPTLHQQRADSFAPHAHTRVDGQPLESYLWARTARLFSGANVQSERQSNGQWEILITQAESDEPLSMSLAVRLTRDGYYLTAAHSVQQQPLYLIDPHGNHPPAAARVVWRSESPDETYEDRNRVDAASRDAVVRQWIDLAILHAPDLAGEPILWAGHGSLRKGSSLILGGDMQESIGLQALAGRVLEILPPDAEMHPVTVEWILFDAPATRGDSGGPVILPTGRLVGILSRGVQTIVYEGPLRMRRELLRTAIAIHPDPDAIMAIVEDDRQQQARRD